MTPLLDMVTSFLREKTNVINKLVVVGTTSPYPTVVIVTMHHQNAAGIEVNGESSSSFSIKYIIVEKNMMPVANTIVIMPSCFALFFSVTANVRIPAEYRPSFSTRITRSTRSTRICNASTILGV